MLARRLGVDAIGDRTIEPALHHLLATVDGPGTNTFFSYRIAEVVADLGGLDALDPDRRPGVLEAVDSTDWLELLDGGALPAELRHRAGPLRARPTRPSGSSTTPTVLDDLLDADPAACSASTRPGGWTTPTPVGARSTCTPSTPTSSRSRWPRCWATCGPPASAPASTWSLAVGAPDGSALAWGRSIGALAVCHTAELAGARAAPRPRRRPGPLAGAGPPRRRRAHRAGSPAG